MKELFTRPKTYQNNGKDETEIEYYQKALNKALERGDKREEERAYEGLGYYHQYEHWW